MVYIKRLYAFELCAASLDQIFLPENNSKKYRGPLPSNFQIAFQIAKGLQHIHNNNLVHRDIKPGNILISRPNQKNGPVTIKLGDFGLSRTTHSNGEFSNPTADKGTLNFMAPEVFHLSNSTEKKGTNKSDVFSSGLAFFALFTGGKHPFGSTKSEYHISQLISNIQQGNAVNMEGVYSAIQ